MRPVPSLWPLSCLRSPPKPRIAILPDPPCQECQVHAQPANSPAPGRIASPGGSPLQPTDEEGAGGQAGRLGKPLPRLGIHSRQQLLPRSGRRSRQRRPVMTSRGAQLPVGPGREAGGGRCHVGPGAAPETRGPRQSRGEAGPRTAPRFASSASLRACQVGRF